MTDSTAANSTRRNWKLWFGPLLLTALVLFLFYDVIFFPGESIVSYKGTDTFRQFLGWREYGFSRLARGELPLWNPHVFGGAPYLAGLQSAIFYPPNWLHLILPTGHAINLIVAGHVLLLGLLTYFWVRNWGLGSMGSTLAGASAMLGAPCFYHVFAGHVTNICSMAWTPLFLLALDKAVAGERRSAVLLGSMALAMQILAGHAQYVYYVLLAGLIYLALRTVTTRGLPQVKICGTFVVLVLLGALLSGAQLWPALAITGETLRGARANYDFSAMFSLPPENLLTLLVPGFFGDLKTGAQPYWGRALMWEMTLFQGLTVVVLALCGLRYGRPEMRRVVGPAFLLMLLLALGSYTPLHRVLYTVLPGFGGFRGASKFIFPASLLLALLAGEGLDQLWRRRVVQPRVALVSSGFAVGVAAVLFLIALVPALGSGPGSLWRGAIEIAGRGTDALTFSGFIKDSNFPAAAAAYAARQCFYGGLLCLLVAALLRAAQWNRYALLGVLLVGVAEVAFFARSHRATFERAEAIDTQLAALLKQNPGDYRVMNVTNPNQGVLMGYDDLWGSDPILLRRYAEVMASMQGYEPEVASQELPLLRFPKAMRLLRARFVVGRTDDGFHASELQNPLPRALLVRDWRLVPSNDPKAVHQLRDPSFDASQTVLLESAPTPAPSSKTASMPGEYVRFTSNSAEELRLEAKVDSPAILLITDNYSEGWKALAEPNSAASSYSIVPANHTQRAIVLGPGLHRMRVVYAPDSTRQGFLLSLLGGVLFVGVLVLPQVRGARAGQNRV